jgi:ATPase subunit of ABC transporter with duplicated ATPase domains
MNPPIIWAWKQLMVLVDVLNEWDGGFVLVRHDFKLISHVAKEIWVCEHRCIIKWKGSRYHGFQATHEKEDWIVSIL